MMSRKRISPWSRLRHALLLSGALIILMPFIWMISTASKPQTEIFSSSVHLIPQTFALWDNLRTAFAKADLWRILLNGLIVTVSIFILQVLVALPAAYAERLRLGEPCVVGRIERDRCLLDLRAVPEDQDDALRRAVLACGS